MSKARVPVWRMPAAINAAIVAGLALALLVDAGTARTMAWVLLSIPLAVIVYGSFRGKRARTHRRNR